MPGMEMNAEQKAALDRIVEATAHLDEVQSVARVAINDAAKIRAGAISDALELFHAKDLAEELGLSVQRVYGLVRDLKQD